MCHSIIFKSKIACLTNGDRIGDDSYLPSALGVVAKLYP